MRADLEPEVTGSSRRPGRRRDPRDPGSRHALAPQPARARRGQCSVADPLRELLEDFLDAIWPPRCWVCGGEAGPDWACAHHRLPARPPGPRCGRCAAALPEVLPQGARCAACRRSPPGFAAALALADYRAQPQVQDWVLALKHGGRRDLARPLGRALGELLRAAGAPREALLVPIPLHPLRRLERGYDQALLLARGASETAGLGVLCALARRRATRPQGEPGSSSRTANVEGAFAPRRGAALLAGREAWLVDDVASSGATASAAARVLRRAGAARVGLLVVARGGGAGGEVQSPGAPQGTGAGSGSGPGSGPDAARG